MQTHKQSIGEMIADIHREAIPSRWLEDAEKAIQKERSTPGKNAFFDFVQSRLAVAESELVLLVPKTEYKGSFEVGRYSVRDDGVVFSSTRDGERECSLRDWSAVMTEEKFNSHLKDTLRKMIGLAGPKQN